LWIKFPQGDIKAVATTGCAFTRMEHATRATLYRQQAQDCRKHAAAAGNPEAIREHWLALAQQYDDLAEQAMQLSQVKDRS
jgi:hypothetical protein